MPEALSASQSKLRLARAPTALVPFRKWVEDALYRIARHAGVSVQIDGAEQASVDVGGNQRFKVSPAGAATVNTNPFTISPTGKVYPGMIGTVMPTLDGEDLDETTNVIDLTSLGGNFKVWLKMTFDTTFSDDGFLLSSTLTAVEVDTGTSVPSATASVKYFQFNTITDGVPFTSYFHQSIDVKLCDDGEDTTKLEWGYTF